MQGTEKARLHFDSVDMPLRGRSDSRGRKWCKEHGLEFDYINENVPENVEKWGNDSRKIFAHEYIDDKATNPVKERAWIRRLRKAKAEKLIPAVIAVASIFAAYGVIAALNLLF